MTVRLTKENLAAYVDKGVPIKRIQFSKEFRAPFFSVIRRLLENPLEELVTTRLPDVRDVGADESGLVLLYVGLEPGSLVFFDSRRVQV